MSERVAVGRVGRPHGVHGAFFVEQPSEDPGRYALGATLLVDGRRAEIVESKRSGGRPVVRLDRDVPRGAALEVDRATLPEPEAEHYYVVDLVGCAVVRDDGELLGRVVHVEDLPANGVLELDSGLLLPLVDDCVREVDVSARRIVVAPGYDTPD